MCSHKPFTAADHDYIGVFVAANLFLWQKKRHKTSRCKPRAGPSNPDLSPALPQMTGSFGKVAEASRLCFPRGKRGTRTSCAASELRVLKLVKPLGGERWHGGSAGCRLSGLARPSWGLAPPGAPCRKEGWTRAPLQELWGSCAPYTWPVGACRASCSFP